MYSVHNVIYSAIVNPVTGDMYVLLAGEVDIETDLGVVQAQRAQRLGLHRSRQHKKQTVGNKDQSNTLPSWWFGTCFVFPYMGYNHPN